MFTAFGNLDPTPQNRQRQEGGPPPQQNYGMPAGQGGAPNLLNRKRSQDEFMRADPNELQQVSTQESPRGNMSFEIGGGAGNRQNFREEYQIDPRGPFRMNPGRPRSNQQLQSLQNPPPMNAVNADIQMPPQIGQDKMMRFNSQVDGKALLHDLD